jgi:hypothetical protein
MSRESPFRGTLLTTDRSVVYSVRCMARPRQTPDYAQAFADCLNAICEKEFGPKAWTKFGAKIGTSAKNAERWCSGDHVPSITQAAEIAKALGQSLDAMVGRVNPPQAVAAAAEAVPDKLDSIQAMLAEVLARLEEAKTQVGVTDRHGARAALELAKKAPTVAEAGRIGTRRRSARGKRSGT